MLTKHGPVITAIATIALLFAAAGVAAAETCDTRAFSASIDETARELRSLNRETERRFQERLQAIGRGRGWTQAETAAKGAEAMDDSRLGSFNTEIEELVSRLDTLIATPPAEMSCDRLAELRTVRDRLLTVMGQKGGFVLSQIETEGSKQVSASSPSSTIATPMKQVPPSAQRDVPPSFGGGASERGTPSPPETLARESKNSWSPNLAKAAPRETQPAPWGRDEAFAVKPPAALAPLPERQPRTAALPPQEAPDLPVLQDRAGPQGYSQQEIEDAGKGTFGTLTSEFAAVINHVFQEYGEPNGYIVGDEGGGAFLAGLRYGSGELRTRLDGKEVGPTPIFWQGPSVGMDFGADGSRTMFLVYKLKAVSALYERFPGIDGTAYVAGGFGVTVFKKGRTIIVPIRTGLGLRIGASLAYLKFTPRASLNPF